MKHKHLYITAFFATALFASCSDYLDELPDNRTELTTGFCLSYNYKLRNW